MRVLVLNGSPKETGMLASALRACLPDADSGCEVDWVDVYKLKMQPCLGCMQCRPDGTCVLKQDDAHAVGEKLLKADCLLVGTPTYWGNMSSQLKVLFDRNVSSLMGESSSGLPRPRHKGKRAVIVATCSAPWPFSLLSSAGGGAMSSISRVLRCGGYKVRRRLLVSGTRYKQTLPDSFARRAMPVRLRMDRA